VNHNRRGLRLTCNGTRGNANLSANTEGVRAELKALVTNQKRSRRLPRPNRITSRYRLNAHTVNAKQEVHVEARKDSHKCGPSGCSVKCEKGFEISALCSCRAPQTLIQRFNMQFLAPDLIGRCSPNFMASTFTGSTWNAQDVTKSLTNPMLHC